MKEEVVKEEVIKEQVIKQEVVKEDTEPTLGTNPTSSKTRSSKKKKDTVEEDQQVPTELKKKKKRKPRTKKQTSTSTSTAVEQDSNDNSIAVPKKHAIDRLIIDQIQRENKKAPDQSTNKGESIVQYDALRDALNSAVDLSNSNGEIHFAPLFGGGNAKFNRGGGGSSSSSSARFGGLTKSDRISNTNAPTAKNRHAEVPYGYNNESLPKKRSNKLNKSVSNSTHQPKEIHFIKSANGLDTTTDKRSNKNAAVITEPVEKKKQDAESSKQPADSIDSTPESQQVVVSLPVSKKKQAKTAAAPDSISRNLDTNPETAAEKKQRKRKEAKAAKLALKQKKTQEENQLVETPQEVPQEKSKEILQQVPQEKSREIPQEKKSAETSAEKKEKRREKKRKEKKEVVLTKKAAAATEKTTEYCHPNDIMRGKNRLRFDPYIDPKICTQRIAEQKYHEGVIRINKRNRSDAYVTCETLDADIFINGLHDRNRALDGDTVIVELIDLEKIWAKKKESVIQKREQRHSTAAERPPQEEGEEDKGKPKYAGKVVYVSPNSTEQTYSGLLSLSQKFSDNGGEPNKEKNIRLAWFKPIDSRAPLIAVQLRYAPKDILANEDKYKNLLMVCKITRWPIDSNNPFGIVTRELGHVGNIAAETEAVLLDNKIIERPFGQKALNGLPEVPWSIKAADITKRRDLRDTRIFTIDPATAKDLDDAVHITKLTEDTFEVGVHIADVSHFINQHTELDHEAYDRGTSTYLCDRVIPMLPSLLCEELCSLNPGVERLAFSVIWKMDGTGNILDTWFGKSVIKSCAKLAYEDAQSVIDGQGLPATIAIKQYLPVQIEQDIEFLYKLSKQMRGRRFANGALSINSIRLSFKLNDLGEPCEVSIYEQKEANRLIEEFMLCANMSVAKKICQHYPDEALLRQHASPHERSLNEFIKLTDNLGYHFDCSTAGSIQESFNKIDKPEVKAVLQLLAVKPMQRAKYFCTGSTDIDKFRHYALNVPLYTHFTSPIRRFADIIVHRQLQSALLGKDFCGYKKSDTVKAASHCNARKEGAKNSQDMNIQLYLSHYLHMVEENTKKPIICSAIITHVLKDCFEILVQDYGLEKRIHMDSLPIERFVFDPHKVALTAYWKEGIESNREFDRARKLDQDYIEPSGIQLYLDHDNNDEDQLSKPVIKIPEELLSDKLIDRKKKMQRFEAFSKIDVRIQVDVERSPPVVYIYPVNPFI